MNIKIRKTNLYSKSPSYAHKGDAGLDLFSAVDINIKPKHRTAVPTGIEMEIPEGYAGLIWDKSGMALQDGIKTMAGVVDSTYRGEIKVVIVNLSSKIIKIKNGDKVAQILVQPITTANIIDSDSLTHTKRGEKGFGSTGKH